MSIDDYGDVPLDLPEPPESREELALWLLNQPFVGETVDIIRGGRRSGRSVFRDGRRSDDWNAFVAETLCNELALYRKIAKAKFCLLADLDPSEIEKRSDFVLELAATALRIISLNLLHEEMASADKAELVKA